VIWLRSGNILVFLLHRTYARRRNDILGIRYHRLNMLCHLNGDMQYFYNPLLHIALTWQFRMCSHHSLQDMHYSNICWCYGYIVFPYNLPQDILQLFHPNIALHTLHDKLGSFVQYNVDNQVDTSYIGRPCHTAHILRCRHCTLIHLLSDSIFLGILCSPVNECSGCSMMGMQYMLHH